MKALENMSQLELAAYVHTHLREHGIDVVLSGGASVSLYSSNRYVSKDVDLINVRFASQRNLEKIMDDIGFHKNGRHFIHPQSRFIVEFPGGPLSVGEEPVQDIREVEFETGMLRVISPTDCVKDRLCAYYYWGDLQGLAQAILVTENNPVDLVEIKRWSDRENKASEFLEFNRRLNR